MKALLSRGRGRLLHESIDRMEMGKTPKETWLPIKTIGWERGNSPNGEAASLTAATQTSQPAPFSATTASIFKLKKSVLGFLLSSWGTKKSMNGKSDLICRIQSSYRYSHSLSLLQPSEKPCHCCSVQGTSLRQSALVFSSWNDEQLPIFNVPALNKYHFFAISNWTTLWRSQPLPRRKKLFQSTTPSWTLIPLINLWILWLKDTILNLLCWLFVFLTLNWRTRANVTLLTKEET